MSDKARERERERERKIKLERKEIEKIMEKRKRENYGKRVRDT